MGATTENPSFELIGALLSRSQVFVLKRLDDGTIVPTAAGVLGGAVVYIVADWLVSRPKPAATNSRNIAKMESSGPGRTILGQ